MKTFKNITIAVIAGMALLFAACSEPDRIEESMALAEKSTEMKGVLADTCMYDGVLSEVEVEGLKLMREEEKLAHDIYSHFFSTYGNVVFENIAKSEQAHMSAVLRLLKGYGIEDPTLEGEGEFFNQELAALYIKLIEEGEKGFVEALRVGATIEDLDINDLQNLLAQTANEDVKRVYENLLAGSMNHLRAFVNTLANLEETYVPQFISLEEFNSIIRDENRNGRRPGQGKGNKGRGNSGDNKGTNAANGDCDGTQSGSISGNQNGAADGTQTRTRSGNQYGSQSGSSNGNTGMN